MRGWSARSSIGCAATCRPRGAYFLQVLILDPDGPAGEAARANIKSMELKLGNEPAPTLPSRRR